MLKTTNKRRRISNIELLRIVALFFIMYGHSHLRIHQMSVFFDVMLSCIAITGVGIFIAISGWFGIRFKRQGLGQYIFQVLFILWAIYGIAIAFHLTHFDLEGVKISMSFYEGFWFIMGYLGLYLISPILNAFVEHSTKRQFQGVLLSYYLFQSYYSWLSAWYDYYGGYSIFLFGGIYLTTAYLRKYPIKWLQKNALWLLICTILIISIIAYYSLLKFGHASRQIRDDNPLVIFASVLLVMIFSKLEIHSKFVNWLAASCFTVYLVHYNPFIYPYYMQLIHYVYGQFDGFIYGLMLLLTLLLVYLGCTLFDQLRIVSWTLLRRIIDKR